MSKRRRTKELELPVHNRTKRTIREGVVVCLGVPIGGRLVSAVAARKGGAAIGVTMEPIRPGALGVVRLRGRAVATSRESVVAGLLLMAGPGGTVMVQGHGKPSIGHALTSASPGDRLMLWVDPEQ